MKKEKCARCGKKLKPFIKKVKLSDREGWVKICADCLRLELSDEVWGATL